MKNSENPKETLFSTVFREYRGFTVMKHGGRDLFHRILDLGNMGAVEDINIRSEFEKELYQLLLQMANNLKCLSDQGLTHNDIKPENIVINDKGEINLADFGATTKVKKDSKDTSPEKLPQSEDKDKKEILTGTPAHMSPEKILRSKCKDMQIETKNGLRKILFDDDYKKKNRNTEILKDIISQKEDIWGLGITILEVCNFSFMKMMGNIKFGWYDDFGEKMSKKFSPSKYEFDDYFNPYIKNCPEGIQHLLRRMLTYDSVSRISAEDLLKESCAAVRMAKGLTEEEKCELLRGLQTKPFFM